MASLVKHLLTQMMQSRYKDLPLVESTEEDDEDVVDLNAASDEEEGEYVPEDDILKDYVEGEDEEPATSPTIAASMADVINTGEEVKVESKRLAADYILAELENVKIYTIMDILWGEYASRYKEVIPKLVAAVNSGIAKCLKDPRINTRTREYIQNSTLPNDADFIHSLEISMAKLYVIYSTWYMDVTWIYSGNTRDSQGNVIFHKEKEGQQGHFADFVVGKALKNIKYPNSNTRQNMVALFQALPIELQQEMLRTPDLTGMTQNLSYLKRSIYEARKERGGLTTANSQAESYSDDLLDISTKSTLRGLISGLLRLADPDNSLSFAQFEKHVMSRFFSSHDSSELNRKISSQTSIDAPVGPEGSDKRSDKISDPGDKQARLEPDETTRGFEANTEQDSSVLPMAAAVGSDTYTGVNLFNEIDNANFSSFLIELIRVKYEEPGKDTVRVPYTPGLSESMVTFEERSLFSWLRELYAPDERLIGGTSIEGRLYDYNDAFISFFNLFSPFLKDSMGLSLPSGTLSDEDTALLKKQLSAFGRAYDVPGLQEQAFMSDSQSTSELKSSLVVKGGKNRNLYQQKKDFISLVEREIEKETSLSAAAKAGVSSTLELIRELPKAIDQYLAIKKVLYPIPDHGVAVLYSASKFCDESSAKLKEIHSAVRKIVYPTDVKIAGTHRSLDDLNLIDGVNLPSKYDPGLTLLLMSVTEVEKILAIVQEFDPNDIVVPGFNYEEDKAYKQNEMIRVGLIKKLMNILDLKRSSTLSEAVERISKSTVIDNFVSDCLPLMDSVFMDARRLVRYLRNFVRCKTKVSKFLDPNDPETPEFLGPDLRSMQKGIPQPPQQDEHVARGISISARDALLKGYLYNVETNNPEVFQEIFDAQEKQTLTKLLGLLQRFIVSDLKTNQDLNQDEVDLFTEQVIKLAEDIKNPAISEVNLDSIKKFLVVFKDQLLGGLQSKKNDQSGSVKLLLRFLSTNTLGHVIGVGNSWLDTETKDLTDEAIAREALGTTASKKRKKFVRSGDYELPATDDI